MTELHPWANVDGDCRCCEFMPLASWLKWLLMGGLGCLFLRPAQAEVLSSFPPPIQVDSADEVIFEKLVTYATQHQLHHQPIGQIIQTVAQQLETTPYLAWGLDQLPTEHLVISLTHFDCFTFVESVWALARGFAVEDYDFKTFVSRIQSQRYRQGEINGYCSRIHYFSDWVEANRSQGLTVDPIQGFRIDKHLDFMSQNRHLYPLLRSNEANFQCISTLDQNRPQSQINYIPVHAISASYSQLQPGDLIGLVTEIQGLDVTHTGLIYQSVDGSTGLIHASPVGYVTRASDLAAYVRNVPKALGITVARATEPDFNAVPSLDLSGALKP